MVYGFYRFLNLFVFRRLRGKLNGFYKLCGFL